MSTMSHDAYDDPVVRAEVHVAATPETVWSFLSDGARFAAWLGAFAGQAPLPGTQVEARVGGAIRVEYGNDTRAVGQITALEPPRRVVFTWGYEGPQAQLAPGSTEVEITLTPTPDGTHVQLHHRGLANAQQRREHVGGWMHYLAMLARQGADAQQMPSLAETLAHYFAAWQATDEAARTAHLSACCTPDVRVRTSFACTNNIAELAAHVAGAQQHMPGLKLEAAGPPQQLHGHVAFAWAVRTPDGKEVFRGVNYAALALDGRLKSLVSFAGSA